MSLWFVYDHEEFYPSAVIVEADTAEEAARRYSVNRGVVVPWHDRALVIGDRTEDELRNDGQCYDREEPS